MRRYHSHNIVSFYIHGVCVMHTHTDSCGCASSVAADKVCMQCGAPCRPDGKQLAVATLNGDITLWDPAEAVLQVGVCWEWGGEMNCEGICVMCSGRGGVASSTRCSLQGSSPLLPYTRVAVWGVCCHICSMTPPRTGSMASI